MNRFKKELRKHQVMLECDYPWLPFEAGSVTLESVVVNSEEASVTRYYTSIILKDYYDRDMTLSLQEVL